jgi:lauroyl/myristoyl acyltransferase
MKDRAAYAISYDVPESRVEKLIKRFAQLSGRLPGRERLLARHNL